MATEAAIPVQAVLPAAAAATPGEDTQRDPIAGLHALKGIILYGATLTFAGLYIYFIIKISTAGAKAPVLDATVVNAAAALAGVLGSAFALEIGTATPESGTNPKLDAALANAETRPQKTLAVVRQALSLEPSHQGAASWPKTFGIWVYAAVAATVSITYVLNQNQTPGTIKTLAVAFGGYVIALITAAYKTGS